MLVTGQRRGCCCNRVRGHYNTQTQLRHPDTILVVASVSGIPPVGTREWQGWFLRARRSRDGIVGALVGATAGFLGLWQHRFRFCAIALFYFILFLLLLLFQSPNLLLVLGHIKTSLVLDAKIGFHLGHDAVLLPDVLCGIDVVVAAFDAIMIVVFPRNVCRVEIFFASLTSIVYKTLFTPRVCLSLRHSSSIIGTLTVMS
mmetsp:Transcript_8472/g.17656  ORF Transcript_8472/g.17656 Transcript_8472/m.17656 type:complete len:201 (-) Transcript_8472:119-721(-)